MDHEEVADLEPEEVEQYENEAEFADTLRYIDFENYLNARSIEPMFIVWIWDLESFLLENSNLYQIFTIYKC